MAIGLTNTVGFSGYRFTTTLTGADAAMVYRVIDGPARIGSAGLVIDVLPVGVTMVTIRGGGVDTTFQLQGIGSLNERSILLAGRASAQTDAQARAAFGGAASASAGLGAVGLLKGGTVAPPTNTVPAAVTSFTAMPGNTQNSLSWIDGYNGGSAITGHKLYAGSASGGETLVGTIATAPPYLDAGLTNGVARYYKISAVNAIGEGPLSGEITATPATPLSISGTPGAATVGQAYSFTPVVSGGTGTKTFALTGTLPGGLSFSTATGAITGTPTVAGTFSGITVTVSDNTGSASLSGLSVVVGAASVTLNALTVSNTSATVGTAFSSTISGLTSGSSIALTGAGSAGLSIAGAVISGTPTTAGAINVVETLAGATNSPRTNSGLATVAAAAITSLPTRITKVLDLDADTITPQADNTALATWTDTTNGVAFTNSTGSLQPKYRTNRVGSHPSIQFTGTETLSALNAAAATLKTAIDTTVWSVYIVYRNAAATANGAMFGNSVRGDGFLFIDNATYMGKNNGPTLGTTASQPTSFSTMGFISSTGMGGTVQAANRLIARGGIVSGYPTTLVGTGGTGFTLGNASPATPAGFFFIGEILRVLAFAGEHTPAEALQVEKHFCDKYAQPYPWAALGDFYAIDGNSLTMGSNASSGDKAWPYLAMKALGRPYGSYTNTAIWGRKMTELTTKAPTDLDPIISQVSGATAKTFVMEFVNERADTSANTIAHSVSYLTARKAAGWAKQAFATSLDYQDSLGGVATRAAYNTYWDNASNRAGLVDGYIPIHLNSGIGVEGSCPNSSPFTPNFSTDGLHLTDAGEVVMAGVAGPIMAAM